MKGFAQILKLLSGYKIYITGNLVFNVFATIFSLFSLAAVAPFLTILFSADTSILPDVAPEFGFSSGALLSYLDYQIKAYILANGPDKTLVYFCFLLIAIFFFKNFSRYMTLFFMAPIRMGVIRDVREAMHNKITRLHLGYFSEERKGGGCA